MESQQRNEPTTKKLRLGGEVRLDSSLFDQSKNGAVQSMSSACGLVMYHDVAAAADAEMQRTRKWNLVFRGGVNTLRYWFHELSCFFKLKSLSLRDCVTLVARVDLSPFVAVLKLLHVSD